MRSTDKKALNNTAKLKPFADADRARIKHKTLPPGILGRIKKLKRLREEKSEVSVAERTIRLGDKKSAASLSLLFPGLGQVYMGQKAFGLSFIFSNVVLTLMYLFLSGILRISVFTPELVPAYDFHVLLIAPLAIVLLSAISIHMAFGLFPELQLARLITANKKNRLYWMALLFPGYGQLLNGQPKKGIAFSSLCILAVFSGIAMFFTYSINWYEYAEEVGVRYLEIALIIMSIIVVVGIFAYLLSIFDAFVVKRNPYLKRPLLKRLGRAFGIGLSPNDKAPIRKTSLKFASISIVLLFFLSLFMLKPGYRTFYGDKIDTAKAMFMKKNMKVIPSILESVKVPDELKNMERTFRELFS